MKGKTLNTDYYEVVEDGDIVWPEQLKLAENIFPDYPGVGSLCIKCEFNVFMEEHDFSICTEPKSPQYNHCIEGHIGCVFASQMAGLPAVAKVIALEGSRRIAVAS